MCTVSYLPTGKKSFILTSNRDEQPSRAASFSTDLTNSEHQNLLFPKDPKAGGTWICLSKTRKMLCLLNGAFEKYIPKKNYRLSRGIMVLDFFKFQNLDDFSQNFNFENIAPFTLVVYENNHLKEFRWDGMKKYLIGLDKNKPNIWSSATLYPKEVAERKKLRFTNWLKGNRIFELEKIRKFHQSGGEDFIIKRNLVETISVTSIVFSDKELKMIHEDLVNQKKEIQVF